MTTGPARRPAGTMSAGQPTGGQFASPHRTIPQGTDLATVTLPLADGRTTTLTPGVWDNQAIEAFQEGQCLAFAVAVAERIPNGTVLVQWRDDDEIGHAVAYDMAQGAITDSYGTISLEDWRHHVWAVSGEDPELEKYEPEGARELADEMEHLPEQHFEVAALFAEHVDPHRR